MFGVCCEAIPRQVNFLADEAGDCGKGANIVISQLDFFFSHHGLGEKEVYLHADNCTGQNKNNCMLHYLAWRSMTGRHTQITLSFLVVGHTKFAPDWCFGLFKRAFRRTPVGSLQGIAQVVNDSAQCNFAQLVTTEDGSNMVPMFDWTDFFANHTKKIPGIKKYHHFRFDSSHPGKVFVRIHSDCLEEELDLLKVESWLPDPNAYPAQLTPKGLSSQRQWYLHDKIREFCPESDKDTTCPRPTCPRPTSRAGTPVGEDELENTTLTRTIAGPRSRAVTSTDDDVSSLPPKKKSRVCGTCGGVGHNSRTCPDKH